MLILVRHAAPDVDPAVPPAEWNLSAEGRDGAASLADVLPADALLVSSLEPKARLTLEPTGPVTTDGRFNEVVRDEAYSDDPRAARSAYVNGTDHDGWETRADVANRFDQAIADWQERAGGRPLVVASHGMAITSWLSTRIGLDDPAAFWLDLQLPDLFAVDVEAKTVRRISSDKLRRAVLRRP